MVRRPSISSAPGFSQAVAGVVAEVEQHTRAELVVAVRPASLKPGWGALLCGAATAWCTLAFCLWSQLELAEGIVAVVVPVFGVLGAIAGELLDRGLLPVDVARRQSARHARAALMELGVHRTRARTGVLVLVDEQEGRVSLAIDAGVEGALGTGRLSELPLGGGPEGDDLLDLPAFLRGLRMLGHLLAKALPADPDDNPQELADGPRFLT